MRLIDADVVMDAIAKQKTSAVSAEYFKGVTECVEKIINAPTVVIKALEDRPTGHWIHEEMASSSFLGGSFKLQTCKCSECGLYMKQECNYCPNCGADMREREGE